MKLIHAMRRSWEKSGIEEKLIFFGCWLVCILSSLTGQIGQALSWFLSMMLVNLFVLERFFCSIQEKKAHFYMGITNDLYLEIERMKKITPKERA